MPDVKTEEIKKTEEIQSGFDLVKETLDIATGKKEVSVETDKTDKTVSSTEQKPSTEQKKQEEVKKEGASKETFIPQTPEEIKTEVDKIRKDYEERLEIERKEKKGIYEDLKKSREKLQQTRQQLPVPTIPAIVPSSTLATADIDTYINNAASTLKEVGFSDKNIEELKDRAIDDPFAVINAVSYAIATHIKDKTINEVRTAELNSNAKDVEIKEKVLADEVTKGWEVTREKISKKYPDLIKRGQDNQWSIDVKSPKFIIYDEEAKKALQEEPWLQSSPQFAELVFQRMEMRLLSEQSFEDGKKSEQQRQAEVEAGFVATGGRQPLSKSKVELSDEEKVQANSDISRGLFKDIDEWAKYKNKRII